MLDFIHWQPGEWLGADQLTWGTLRLLKFLPQADFLAAVESGPSFTLWDLRVLGLPQLFDKSLGQAQPDHLAAIETVREKSWTWPDRLKATIDYLELIIRHRFRFEMELAQAIQVEPDKFDIEIED